MEGGSQWVSEWKQHLHITINGRAQYVRDFF